jgi:hypothetical protein
LPAGALDQKDAQRRTAFRLAVVRGHDLLAKELSHIYDARLQVRNVALQTPII